MMERPELLSAAEYHEICMEMLAFQEANNRLSYTDEDGGQAAVAVADKSLQLTETAGNVSANEDFVPLEEGAGNLPEPGLTTETKPSLFSRVLGPFRSP